jgi:phosphoglucomutase
LNCDSGIVITASHNPKEYNGYKAYWSDGGQLVPPHDKNVIAEVRKIQSVEDVQFTRNEKLVQYIGKDIDEVYISTLKTLSMNPDMIEKHNQLNIVYSPLHGTGTKIVPAALSVFGFKNINLVKEQAIADGNFPTVISPNPEESEALTMAIKQAKATHAELVMATDPDSDRVGIAIKDNKGEFVLLNGNMTASLIFYYVCKMWLKNNKLTGKEYIISTIVTTNLLNEIAYKYNVKCYEVLTGFKYIAEKIRELEGKETFICGGEESYGYLIGDHARDKDAVISCCIIAEIAAWAKEQQKSLFDILTDIYLEFGYYKERLFSLTKKGQNGAKEIEQMMKNYRNNPPQNIQGVKVTKIKDYKLLEEKCLLTNTIAKINLPTSDVLQFVLEDKSTISIRPSGTEPKIKFYFSVSTPLPDCNDFDKTTDILDKKIDEIMEEVGISG